MLAQQQLGQGSTAGVRLRRARPPPGRARCRRAARSTTSRVRGSAAHTWSGAPGQHRLAHGVGVVEGVALVEVADVQTARGRDPAGVRRLLSGQHAAAAWSCRRRCARRRRSARRPPLRGDLVEQRSHAVGLGDPLEVDEVGHQSTPEPPRGRRRPGRGRRAPLAGHRPRAALPATVAGVLAGLAEEHAGRARTRTPARAARPPSIPSAISRSRDPAAGRSAACSRSLCRAAASRSASPAASGREHVVGRTGHLRGSRAAARRSGGRPPAWRAPRADGTTTHHHVPRSSTRVDDLAVARRRARAAEQRERHVAAQAGREPEQVLVGGAAGPTAGPGPPAPRRRRRCRRRGRRRPGCPWPISTPAATAEPW